MDSREKVRAFIDQISVLTHEEKNIIVEETIIEESSKGTILLRQGQVPTRENMSLQMVSKKPLAFL